MRKYPDLFLMVVVLGTLLLFSFSVIFSRVVTTHEKNHTYFNAPDSLFHSGDLIFRDGRGVISSAFKRLSLTDPKYSHVGIIHFENGRAYVYHVIGGEEDFSNKMRKDLMTDFCSNIQSNSFAIYRTDLNANKIDSIAGNYYKNKLEFDSKFDLNTDDKMYCTELVYKILTSVSKTDNFLPLSTVSGIKYSACDNIYLSPHVKKIFSFDYSH